jgi:2'-5' RNA ligase
MAGADLRLFVAAYPPVATARAALAAIGRLDLAPHRPTPLEQIHLTLCFIGDIPARDLDAVRESVERSAAGLPAFTLTPRRLITLPHRGRPRLVALETDTQPTLLELVRRLAKRLARRVREEPTDRFLPHLTLCRFTHSADPRPLDEPVDLPAFTIERIALMRSVLLPAGAEHRTVMQTPLGPPNQ